MTEPPAPKIYEPADPDELRDGLFRGFWLHRKKQVEPKE